MKDLWLIGIDQGVSDQTIARRHHPSPDGTSAVFLLLSLFLFSEMQICPQFSWQFDQKQDTRFELINA